MAAELGFVPSVSIVSAGASAVLSWFSDGKKKQMRDFRQEAPTWGPAGAKRVPLVVTGSREGLMERWGNCQEERAARQGLAM